jgi:hypothetical protein
MHERFIHWFHNTHMTFTGGGAATLEQSCHDKNERTVVYERHVMGTTGGGSRSSASCPVYVPAKQHCPCTCS